MQISDERDHSVENLGFHAKRMIPQWKDLLIRPRDTEKVPGREPGSPTLLVLCSSAIRAVELLRFVPYPCHAIFPCSLSIFLCLSVECNFEIFSRNYRLSSNGATTLGQVGSMFGMNGLS